MASQSGTWDFERARSMLGARVLIGVTYVQPDGERVEQMFGTIVSVDSDRGFEIRLEGARAGQIYWLPPHIDAFHAASPGEYRLSSTGEVVTDPDYTTVWRFEKPSQ